MSTVGTVRRTRCSVSRPNYNSRQALSPNCVTHNLRSAPGPALTPAPTVQKLQLPGGATGLTVRFPPAPGLPFTPSGGSVTDLGPAGGGAGARVGGRAAAEQGERARIGSGGVGGRR